MLTWLPFMKVSEEPVAPRLRLPDGLMLTAFPPPGEIVTLPPPPFGEIVTPPLNGEIATPALVGAMVTLALDGEMATPALEGEIVTVALDGDRITGPAAVIAVSVANAPVPAAVIEPGTARVPPDE